jgi:hypothetical protein
MEDFSIRPAVDADRVHILETMNPSSAPVIASDLPVDQFYSLQSFLDCSHGTSSDVCHDWLFDPSDDQFDPLPCLDYGVIEMVDPYRAEILHGLTVTSDILDDEQVL